MKLPEFGVRRPVTATMIFLGFVILGSVAFSMLGLDVMPEMEIPSISVITTYRGAGSEEIERTITEPLEEAISTVPKVKEVRSVSREGVSTIKVQFDWDVNLDEVTNDLRDKIDMAIPNLPRDADTPRIFKFDFSMFPVIILGVNAKENYTRLEKIIEDKISNPIKRIPGVASTRIRGGLTREIQVLLDKQKMAAFNVSLNQLTNIIKAENVSKPGGHLKIGTMDYLIRTPEEFESVAEIGEIVVSWNKGRPIHLKDIAEIKDDFEEKTEDIFANGKSSMVLFVSKQSGANTVDVSNLVQKQMKNIQATLPPDVKMEIIIDSSDFIRQSVNNLKDTVIWGGVFVFFVTLIFLRSIRSSLIIAVAIPTSLIVTFVLMYINDYTINQVSLSSLAIAMGMVVDNAIVVLDSISLRRERGERAQESAIYGSSEVGMAITASTLTTVAIFVPIVFVGGITKVMFGQLAIVVTMALLSSLLVALTLIPMLCSKFLNLKQKGQKKTGNFLFNASEAVFVSIEKTYGKILGWALRYKAFVILISLALLGATYFGVTTIGTEFLPEQDNSMFTVYFQLPVGSRFEETAKVSHRINKIIQDNVPELKICLESYGTKSQGGGPPSGRDEMAHNGMLRAVLVNKAERKASVNEIIKRVRPFIENIPGADVQFSAEDPIAAMMFGSGKDLSIDITGYDLESGRKYAEDIKKTLLNIKGVKDVEISRESGMPEIQVSINKRKASSLGLNTNEIGRTIETYFSGRTVSTYREGGDEYDITLRLQEKDRRSFEDLRNVFIASPSGVQIPLSSVATITPGTGPTKIERKNQERIITVNADIYDRDLGSVVAEAKDKLSKLTPPQGFSYIFAGRREEQQSSFLLLLGALILGSLLVYMVMASQFESLRDPFIIFFSIPFSFIGSVWILVLTGQTLSLISFIGVIMLVGIVVNNGIVLISYIGILRQRGQSISEAVTNGGMSRLRPVLMTTLTTVCGLLPMALSRGEGSEVWVPLSLTVIGGLLVSMLITLVFMPTLYSVFEGRKERRALNAKKLATGDSK